MNLISAMKQAFLFLIAILAFSCESEEDPESVSYVPPVLVRKIVVTNEDSPTLTSTLTYDGQKLVRINASDGSVANYEYTGNVITKIEYTDDSGISKRETFDYSSDGRMSTYTKSDLTADIGTRETYVYNTNGTTTITSFIGNATSQITPNGSGTIIFSAGEVSEITTSFSDSHIYSYDNKNNPFQNILGMDKISFAGAAATGIFHNITLDVSDTASTVISYMYNDTEFPKKATASTAGITTTTEYFYE